MAVYLDASALMKLILVEAESEALAAYLRPLEPRVSAAIARTEVLRAVRRHRPHLVEPAERMLRGMSLVDVDHETLGRAVGVEPPETRSLDAIHVATALMLRSDLDVLITYDTRMRAAAELSGLRVVQPGAA